MFSLPPIPQAPRRMSSLVERLRVLILLTLLIVGCGQPASVPSSMNAADLRSLEAVLQRLDGVLAARASEIHANLAPGATSEEIEELRAGLEGNQIDALETWFRWHNGVTGTPRRLLPLGVPLSIREALDDREMIRRIPLVGRQRRAVIKILDDGAGDGYFLDITSATPRVYYEMLEDPGPVDFGTLHEFVEFIADAFDSGVISLNERGDFDYDLDEYFPFEAAYLDRISDN
jgi:hypothetical protein